MPEISINDPSVFKKVKIFYFSGTGNALSVSKWFAEVADDMKVKNEIVDLSEIGRRESILIEKDSLIGFCSPTHGFNFPPVTLKFLWRFPRGNNQVFIMNTRAGMKLWKFHLVGLSGIAQLFAATILKVKGYKIVGMRPVDLPSNWISVHPGLRRQVISSIFSRCERNTKKFAHKIISGGRGYRALLDIIQDLAITPVAFAYYIIGRFVLAKSFVASSACTMCGLCINSCPVGAIKSIGDRPYWTFKCESCMRCMNKCPERAIQTAHGLVIGSLYLLFTIGMEWLYFISVDFLPVGKFTRIMENGLVEFTIASALCILFLWVAYRLVHFLMRFKLFEWLIIYSSLTVFKFWRRYKGRPKISKKVIEIPE
jgi:Pyruvate/2-oxoacid:ferredoxin oxidoreductase delta subunit